MNADVLELRVSSLEHVVSKVSEAVESIDGSLKVLARLEEKHEATRGGVERAFKEIEDHETRLRKLEAADAMRAQDSAKLADHETRIRDVEDEMPTLKLSRKWVLAGAIGTLSVVGLALLALVVG